MVPTTEFERNKSRVLAESDAADNRDIELQCTAVDTKSGVDIHRGAHGNLLMRDGHVQVNALQAGNRCGVVPVEFQLGGATERLRLVVLPVSQYNVALPCDGLQVPRTGATMPTNQWWAAELWT